VIAAGVDTGGTFTDVYADDGRVAKVASTPDDPSRAVVEGLARLGAPAPLRVIHGTTVGTNALLTRAFARTAFVTTRGFEDLLEIGRQERRDLYALEPRKHDPLVLREDRFGVRERLRADGTVETPLALEDLVARVRASGARAVAVCLLHAYRNPDHERRVGEALAATGLPVSLSHEVCDEFREFERAATTAVNAALVPILAPYLLRLETALEGRAVEILQSNGGAASCAEVARFPVRTILSGPAGGVLAAAELARLHSIEAAVSFDMGGTSTDVSLLHGGPMLAHEFRLEGLPVRVPILDVRTVGAGGGSIARLDAMGALRVGPESAGADPGPACCGRGELPTVTDAHVALGHVDALLDGAIELDRSRALRAVGSLARDILRVANATMERALRSITVRRGVDPKGLTLIAFGGAGGLHACALADALGFRDVLVPPGPGAFSARGMAGAERRRDRVRTVLLPAEACIAGLEALLAPMRGRGAGTETATADVRYAGQSHELTVPADARLVETFHAAHERAYGYCDRARRVEVVNLRLTTTEPIPRPPPLPPRARVQARRGLARMRREALDGAVLGPCVLAETTATTLLPEGWRAQRLADGSLLLERAP
jgi:N-methylhydantoinase A